MLLLLLATSYSKVVSLSWLLSLSLSLLSSFQLAKTSLFGGWVAEKGAWPYLAPDQFYSPVNLILFCSL